MADVAFKDYVNGLTEETTPDPAADYLAIVDASGGVVKKIKISNLLSTNLSLIRALAPSLDDFIQMKPGGFTNRSPAQVKADMGLTAAVVSVSGSPTAIAGVWSGSQAEYDGLTPDANTLYFIV